VHPLDLTVERDNGTVIARGQITQPFAVLGRDPTCDLTISDGGIAPRQLALQVVAGRLFAVDLSGKPGGLTVGGVPRSDAWLSEDEPIRVGPFRLALGTPVGVATGPANFHPLVPNPDVVSQFAKATVEFRNGRTAQSRWDVNRIMTFVGRAKACKINLTSEDVSLFHCYFLLTFDGLWVVDALGRGGVSIDGIPVRFARLNPKDDLRVARFHLGCSYPNGEPADSVIPLAAAFAKAPATPPQWPLPDPGPEAVTHAVIRPSAPSTPLPFGAPPQPAAETPSPRVDMPKDLVLPGATAPVAGDLVSAPMFEQFQQSMLMMMKMFGQMQQQQMAGIQQEMARLATLTEELHKIQMEVARGVAPAALPHHNPLPAPDDVPAVNEETANQHQFVFDRIAKMEAERQTIWKRLAGMMGPKPVTA
jgi:hypothetical protein